MGLTKSSKKKKKEKREKEKDSRTRTREDAVRSVRSVRSDLAPAACSSALLVQDGQSGSCRRPGAQCKV